MFDLAGQKPVTDLPGTGEDPLLAVVFEPRTTKLLAFAARHATAIDAVSYRVTGSIDLDGLPAAALADGSGRVFVTMSDLNQVDVINAARKW